MIFVTKFDGRKQVFNKGKIVRTCLRMRANLEQANDVANKIEEELYDGITTKEILRKVFSYLKEYKPEVRHRIDLREAIALLRPKPDFEQFVSLLLKEYGYRIETNQIIAGKCVEHEIDAVARRNNEILLVEVKHHLQSHTYTGLHIFLEVQAVLEDLLEGYRWKKNNINFNKALVVCNTKISDHARDYAVCKGIDHIGWRFPEEKGLEQMVEEKRFYPVTLLKDLDADTQTKLGDNGIVLLKQLLEMNSNEIFKKTKVDRQKIEKLIKKTREIWKF